ncbi:MAG: phytanoyl-CoA dioxygenase family protein, partial [Dehalococcoidia bacterium]|nr:phytanoyl-CoA dioxygenase family protein [Dehalococcoidia bacterium]
MGAVRAEAEGVTEAQGVSSTYQGVHSARGIPDQVSSFFPYLSDERVLGVATRWFGPHVRISFTNTLMTEPGNQRGGWHADWPYNQEKAGHIPVPYADSPIQLSTLWMLSDFTLENGGTLIVPGSHRTSDNPTGTMGVDRFEKYPTEMQVTGAAGTVLVFDSRLWHATASNMSNGPRVGMVVRYAPWWLNLEVLMPGSDERKRIVEESGLTENEVPPVPA